MWRFYQEDSPGLKVYVVYKENQQNFNFINYFLLLPSGPVPVLVMSLIFIASVFVLHIWGKYTRG